MKIVALALLLLPVIACANSPEYRSMRRWVEERQRPDVTIPKDALYIAHVADSYAHLLEFHDSMSLRTVIDATPYRGAKIAVIVLRISHDAVDPVFDRVVTPKEQPRFALKAGDVICFGDPLAPR